MLDSDANSPDELLQTAQSYLCSTLQVSLTFGSWSESSGLPLFLAKGFSFGRTSLFGHEILFAARRTRSLSTPSELTKQIASLQKRFDGTVVLVLEYLSAYQRGRLIEESVPFLVPKKQLFVPQLAIDLREHFRSRQRFVDGRVSPVAQALLLRHLIVGDAENARPTDLSLMLRYSAMSVGRALEELEAQTLCRVEKRGRSKHVLFAQTPRDLFNSALPRLRSPVKACRWYRATRQLRSVDGTHLPEFLSIGGDSALAEFSTIARPRIPRFAAGPSGWKRLQNGDFGKEVHEDEDPDFGVDVWRYDPEIVSGGHEVDRLSLHLQFRDHADERLQAAADLLLEDFTW